MHALLAHMYHLALYAIHIATRPVWRPLATALGVAATGRLAGFARRPAGAALVAGAAVLAGWCVEAPPTLAWPLPPVARLTGLAALLTIWSILAALGWQGWKLPLVAGLGAWWLVGMPPNWPSVLRCAPVFLGLWAVLALGPHLARRDRGWAALAAAGGLAGGLLVSGASPHWARAAGVPAMVAWALLGVPDAMPAIAGLIAALALTALVASDLGRLVPVDVACVAPLLAWVLMPRLERGGAVLACVGAACLCVGLAWLTARVSALS